MGLLLVAREVMKIMVSCFPAVSRLQIWICHKFGWEFHRNQCVFTKCKESNDVSDSIRFEMKRWFLRTYRLRIRFE